MEDHDDLVPIFNRQSEALSETYGDYFLAELIEATDENMKCIVAEVGAGKNKEFDKTEENFC